MGYGMQDSRYRFKKFLQLLPVLLLCSCVYEVPLVENATVPVDSALTGTWQGIPKKGEAEDPSGKMIILPFSKTEYVVICSPDEEDRMIFRAYPVQTDGFNLVQLEWLQADQGRYHICRYELSEDGTLTVETLSPKLVDKEINDSKTLRETLLANRDNPNLFSNPLRYRKLSD
jgi:hypothetical protein